MSSNEHNQRTQSTMSVMTMPDNNKKRIDDVQMSALAASVAILVSAAIYWVIQIQGVRDMLEMAYG